MDPTAADIAPLEIDRFLEISYLHTVGLVPSTGSHPPTLLVGNRLDRLPLDRTRHPVNNPFQTVVKKKYYNIMSPTSSCPHY